MTLYFGKKDSDSVFDIRNSNKRKTTNVIRRLFTKCSRPIFTEKHVRLEPAKSYFLRKCYCSKYTDLFQFQSFKINKKVRKLKVLNEVKNTCELLSKGSYINKCQTRIKQLNKKLKLYEANTSLSNDKRQDYCISKNISNKKLTIHKYINTNECLANPILNFSILTTQIKKDIIQSSKDTISCKESFYPSLPTTRKKIILTISSNIFEITKKNTIPITKAISCNISASKDIIPWFKSNIFANINHYLNFSLRLKINEKISRFSNKMIFIPQILENKTDIAHNLVIQMWQSLDLSHKDFISKNSLHTFLFQEKLSNTSKRLNHQANIFTLNTFSTYISEYTFPNKKIILNHQLLNIIAPKHYALNNLINTKFRVNLSLLKCYNRQKHHLKLRLHLFEFIERPHCCSSLGLTSSFKIANTVSNLTGKKKLDNFNMLKRTNTSFSPFIFWNSVKLYKAYFCIKNTISFLKTRSHAKYTHRIMHLISDCSKTIEALVLNCKSNLSPQGTSHRIFQTSPIKLNNKFTMWKSLRINEQKILAPRHIIKDIKPINTITRELCKFSLYSENLHTTMLKRRGNPLLNYLFSSQISSINFRNDIKSNTTKLSYKAIIKSKFDISHIKQIKTNQLIFNSVNILRDIKNKTSFGITKNFTFSNRIPQSITNQLNLIMLPKSLNQTNYINQSSIIPPPDWSFTEKSFNCRIILTPFPFGFPSLRFKSFSPVILSSNLLLAVQTTSKKKISTNTVFFTKRTKAFRSPLSLKEPKRWLWPPISDLIDETVKETTYINHNAITFSDINQLKSPHFLFSWEINQKSTIPVSYFRFSSDLGQKTLSTIHIDHSSFIQTIPFQITNYVNSIKSIKTASIQKIILPFSSMKPVFKKGNFNFNSTSNTKKDPIFCNSDAKLKIIEIRKNNHLFKIITTGIKSFTHQTPLNISNITLVNTIYKARNRLFFFPWAPSYSKFAPISCEVFFELEDSQIIPESNISDDTIITQMPDLNKLDPHTISSYQSKLKINQKSFNLKIQSNQQRSTFKDISNSIKYIVSTSPILNINQSNAHTQSLIPKIEQTSKLSINLNSSKFEQFSYSRSLTIREETVDKIIYYSPNFKMDSVHWIILLSSFLNVSEKALIQQPKFLKAEYVFFPKLAVTQHKTNYYKASSTISIPKLSYNKANFPLNIPKKKISIKWSSFKLTTKYFSPKHTISSHISNYNSPNFNLSLLLQSSSYEVNNIVQTNLLFKSLRQIVPLNKEKKANPKLNFKYKQLKQENFKQLNIPDWFDLSEINSRINLNVSSIIDLELERN